MEPEMKPFVPSVYVEMLDRVLKHFFIDPIFIKMLNTIKDKKEFSSLLENIYRLGGAGGLKIFLEQQMDEFNDNAK